jgi:hypothetical protein
MSGIDPHMSQKYPRYDVGGPFEISMWVAKVWGAKPREFFENNTKI